MTVREALVLAALATAATDKVEVAGAVVATALDSTAQTGDRPEEVVAIDGQTQIRGSGGGVVVVALVAAVRCFGGREVAKRLEAEEDGAMDEVMGEEGSTLNL